MPNVREILPKKERETGKGRAMRPFTHSMEEFFGNRFPGRWMEGFFDPMAWRWPFAEGFEERLDVLPKLDILDKDDALVIRAEMPGVRKEDIDVTISGDRLTLEAKREFKEEEKKDEYYRHEMAYGRLYRAIRLPVDVVVDTAKADLKDGILEIYLPKTEATTPHTVKVA